MRKRLWKKLHPITRVTGRDTVVRFASGSAMGKTEWGAWVMVVDFDSPPPDLSKRPIAPMPFILPTDPR